MGGGDLNLKKEWHPLTFKNQEMVWLAERRQEQEERKMEQLKKELEQERAMQELVDLNLATGRVKNRVDRLDWMYTGPSAVGINSITSEEKEAFLLGKKRVDSLIDTGVTAEDLRPHRAFTLTEAAVYGFQANSWKDTQSKIREDPLLAIRRREGASLQAVMANPLKVREMMDKKKKKKKSSKDVVEEKDVVNEKVDMREVRRRDRSRSNERQDRRYPVSRDQRDRRDDRSMSRDKYRRRSPSPRRQHSRSPPRRRSRSPPSRRLRERSPHQSSNTRRPVPASKSTEEKAAENALKLQEMMDDARTDQLARDSKVKVGEDDREVMSHGKQRTSGSFINEMRMEGLERRR